LATTRQGIKNTIPPAGNVGERARRRQGPQRSRAARRIRAERPPSWTARPGPTRSDQKQFIKTFQEWRHSASWPAERPLPSDRL
jgi:hypothetical protein